MFDSPREKPELARAGQNRAEPGSVDVCFGGSPEASFLGALPYRKVVEERSADSRQSAAGPAEPPVAHRLSANRALLRALSFAPTSLTDKEDASLCRKLDRAMPSTPSPAASLPSSTRRPVASSRRAVRTNEKSASCMQDGTASSARCRKTSSTRARNRRL